MAKITNGIITSAHLGFDRDAFLSLWVFVKHEDGGVQGFGGYVLGGVPGIAAGRHATQPNIAAEHIVGVLRAAGVERLDQLPGKAIRVERESDEFDAKITGIGHIIEGDKWFRPAEANAKLKIG